MKVEDILTVSPKRTQLLVSHGKTGWAPRHLPPTFTNVASMGLSVPPNFQLVHVPLVSL